MSENKIAPVDIKGWPPKVCTVTRRLDDKIAVVTGANTGIGLITAAELARRGCIVIMGCRDMDRARAAKDKIISTFGQSNSDCLKTDIADETIVSSLSPVKPEQLVLGQVDLESLDSVRHFADWVMKAHPGLNFLVNNAGLIVNNYETTADGFEKTIGINHLGPFLLTELLLPALKRSAPSRIINVSSLAHQQGILWKPDLHIPDSKYDTFMAYSQSKLANVMHARELSRRLEGSGVVAASLHPGVVKTEFTRNFKSPDMLQVYALYKPFEINAWQGAQTTMYTLLTENLEPGAYYDNCTLATPNQLALDDSECKWLWDKSCELIGWKSPTST